MDKILEILESVRPDVDFKNEKKLIDDGILDSFDIISIVNELNKKYGIKIKVGDMTADNFDSAEKMLALIERLK